MEKKMVKVKRDLMAEKTGLSSMVGETVEIVCKIPGQSEVQVYGGTRTQSQRTLREVYLVIAKEGRFMKGLSRSKDVFLSYEGHVGNDVYSEDELEIPR